MRTRIKVTDLSLAQWDYLTSKVPVDGREFLAGIPRACVVFELTPDFSELHIEMDLVELAGLMVTLTAMDLRAVAQAALTPDALPEPCEHGAAVVKEEPWAFAGAQLTRTYADGCQSYGPYQPVPGSGA
jgi:hypothetical protein